MLRRCHERLDYGSKYRSTRPSLNIEKDLEGILIDCNFQIDDQIGSLKRGEKATKKETRSPQRLIMLGLDTGIADDLTAKKAVEISS